MAGCCAAGSAAKFDGDEEEGRRPRIGEVVHKRIAMPKVREILRLAGVVNNVHDATVAIA